MKFVKILPMIAIAAFAGCATTPVTFVSSSMPIPKEGYVIYGSEVSGVFSQVWVFGFGGNDEASCLQEAYRNAMILSGGADALVAMGVEQSTVSVPPFYTRTDTRVTGTPVKFKTSVR